MPYLSQASSGNPLSNELTGSPTHLIGYDFNVIVAEIHLETVWNHWDFGGGEKQCEGEKKKKHLLFNIHYKCICSSRCYIHVSAGLSLVCALGAT